MKALLISITLLVAFIISLNLSSQKVNKRKEMPKNGFVPDAGTAKKIAEAIWVPIYGQEMIDGEKPFQAELFHDTAWHVN